MHYGVLGMKWGVRHDRSKARAKATAKTRKLSEKAKRARQRSYDAEMKLAKRRGKRAKTDIGYGLQERAFRKANSKKYKSMRADKKLAKWEKAVKREFDSANLRDIDNKKAYKQLLKKQQTEEWARSGYDPWDKSRAKSDGRWYANAERRMNPDKYATRKQAEKYKRQDRKNLEREYTSSAKSAGVELSSKQKANIKTMSDDQLQRGISKNYDRATNNSLKRAKERQAEQKKEFNEANEYFTKLEKAEAKLNSQLQAQARKGNKDAWSYLNETGTYTIDYDKNGNPIVKKRKQ